MVIILLLYDGKMVKQIKQPKEPIITIFPYPVYLLSCEYQEKSNIAPIGWVAPVCNEPPMFGVSLRLSRYSHDLVENSGKFALNVPTQKILEEVDYCGTFSGKDLDKIRETGLTLVKTSEYSPPIIEECPVNLECKVKKTENLGSHTHFIGEVEKILVDDNFRSFSNFFVVVGTDYYGLSGLIGGCQNVYLRKFGG